MYSRLQYISQGVDAASHWRNIQAALDAGCTWVQLRCKHLPEATVLSVATHIKKICESYNALLIVNDNVHIAKAANADGVHLGLDDMHIADARVILGADKIIGGTANTLEHLIQRAKEGCNYIGLGPYRFTTTKEKLSPILGAQGYKERMDVLEAMGISIPVYAIGGILLDDVQTIMNTGVYGIAVSGLITQAVDQKNIVQQLNKVLNGSLTNSR